MPFPESDTATSRTEVALTAEQLNELRQFDTCTLANAIEKFDIRLRNQGFTGPGLRPFAADLQLLIGYAATVRVKSSNPPMQGGSFHDRNDWWASLLKMPAPCVAVVQDLEPAPGHGSVAGLIHCEVLQKLGCTGLITNGAVRDIPALRQRPFPVFAVHVAVSHSYYHVVDFGQPVEILGLEIRAGDLIAADCHGVLSIPKEVASRLPEVAASIVRHERRIVDLCRSHEVSLEELKNGLTSLD
jgi:4-hydroxy-4-methyl-2-oxoglutarate aldolase